MGIIDKSLALVLILIMAISSLSLMIVSSALAQSIPKPSVPEFTIKSIGPSFDIPPIYSSDSETGQIVIAENGYHIEYSAVEITITNQLLPISFYNIRIKGHNQPDNYWNELFRADEGFLKPSNSNYTRTTIPVEGAQNVGIVVPTGTQTDIQVEAMIGRISRQFNPNATSQIDMYPYVFSGETSGWSNTQIVTLPTKTPLNPNPTSSSPTTTPTTCPTSNSVPLNMFVAVVAVFSVVVVAQLILLFRRHQKPSSLSK